MSDLQDCINFILANGWHLDVCGDDSWISYTKPDGWGIEIATDESEIVFLDDTGDFARISVNYYELVGFLYVNRQPLVIPERIESKEGR